MALELGRRVEEVVGEMLAAGEVERHVDKDGTVSYSKVGA